MSREYGPRPDYHLNNTENLHRYFDSLILHDQLNIVQSSGLQRFRRRRWSVIQTKTPQGDLIPGYCVLLVDLWIYNQEIEYHITTEEEGFHQYEIPQKMLALAMETPPPNDLAAAWREDCQTKHQELSATNQTLRQIRKLYKEKERPIPIQVGNQQVNYSRRHYKGRLRDFYQRTYPGDGRPNLLSPSQINQEATTRLLLDYGK